MTEAADLPEFFILCGFLGAGKTTLLLDLLDDPGFPSTAVIVNEAGEINIDGATISSSNSGLEIAQLTRGCVCCAMVGDLPYTVAGLMDDNDIQGRPPIQRIVLETSGLSRPAPILRQLMGLPVPFRVTVISVFDCANPLLRTDYLEETAAQLAASQTIVLTKTDLISTEDVAEAKAFVASINPLARMVEDDVGPERVRAAFAQVGRGTELFRSLVDEKPALLSPHARIKVYFAVPDGPLEPEALYEWLDNLSGYCGPRLLRTKGIVQLTGIGCCLVQSVGTVYDPPRAIPETEETGRGLVVIARDLSLDELEEIGPALKMRFSATSGA